MPRRLSTSLLLALRINAEAIKENLVEFHGRTRAQARALVAPLEAETSDMVLHSEPYIAAFELAHGTEALPPEQYQAHRARAVEILEEARAHVGRDFPKFNTAIAMEKFMKLHGSKTLTTQSFKVGSLKKFSLKKPPEQSGFKQFKKEWGKVKSLPAPGATAGKARKHDKATKHGD